MCKSIIVFAFAIFIATAYAQESPDLDQCIKESNASDADVQTFKSNSVPTTHSAGCLMACMGKKFGMMYSNNTFNLDKALQNIQAMRSVPVPQGLPADLPDKLTTAFTTCKKEEVANSDACQAALSFSQCMETQRKALNLPERPTPAP